MQVALNKLIIIFLSVLLIFPLNSKAFGENNAIKKGEVLTLERCITIGLNNNPNIALAQNTAKIYRSRIGEANAGYFPQLGITSGYSRGVPVSSLAYNPTNNQYSSGITVNQLICDFGKTPTQAKIQKLDLVASNYNTNNTSVQTAFNVKQAYYQALLAKISKDIYDQTIKNDSQLLTQTKAFFQIGTKSKIDVTTAEVTLSNDKLNSLKANDTYKTAIASLSNAMGVFEQSANRIISPPGDEDDRNLLTAESQFLLKIGSGHVRHGDVEDQALRLLGKIEAEKRFRRRKCLSCKAEFLEQVGEGFADGFIIINNTDQRAVLFHTLLRACLWCGGAGTGFARRLAHWRIRHISAKLHNPLVLVRRDATGLFADRTSHPYLGIPNTIVQ